MKKLEYNTVSDIQIGDTVMLNGRMFHYLVEFPTRERLWYDAPCLRKVGE